jgi:hypothetical protein
MGFREKELPWSTKLVISRRALAQAEQRTFAKIPLGYCQWDKEQSVRLRCESYMPTCRPRGCSYPFVNYYLSSHSGRSSLDLRREQDTSFSIVTVWSAFRITLLWNCSFSCFYLPHNILSYSLPWSNAVSSIVTLSIVASHSSALLELNVELS